MEIPMTEKRRYETVSRIETLLSWKTQEGTRTIELAACTSWMRLLFETEFRIA